MYVYKDHKDAVESVVAYANKRIEQATTIINNSTPRSHVGMEARAERAAYQTVVDMLTNYTVRNDNRH